MKHICPECEREIRTHTEKRYLDGDYTREKKATMRSDLYLFDCKHRECRHSYLLRRDRMVNSEIGVDESISYDWSAWRTAKKHRPGEVQMGTTASDLTNLIHHDTAGIYHLVIKRYPLQAPSNQLFA